MISDCIAWLRSPLWDNCSDFAQIVLQACCCGVNCKDWECVLSLVAWLWIDRFIFDCICHVILSNESSEADDAHLRLWPQALLFTESCILSDTMKPQWFWSSLIEHENLLCCQSGRLCISSLMDAPFNYSCASLLAITFFYIQDLESGSSGWVADLGFLIGVCVCVLPYSVESVVSLGVGAGGR